MRKFVPLLGALLLFSFPSIAVAAPPAAPVKKPAPGRVAGKVTNLLGEPMPGATVEIVKVGSPHKRFEVETDKSGAYSIPNLEPGAWKMSISAPNMLSSERNVTIESGKDLATDIQLEDIEASDVLRVTGQRTLVHPERIGTTTGLDREFLEQYGSGNDLRKDIETTPGVIEDSVGNIITRGEHNAVNYELDGVILPETAGVLNQAQFASPRSLESMSVDIGGYQAKDGGGPLGAVVRMRSLPIPDKPTGTIGYQIGGPIQGGINYYFAGAVSQNKNSILNRLRFETSGTYYGTKLGIEAPFRNFARNGRAQINSLSKIEFSPTEKDRFKLTVGLNESFLGWPTSKISRAAGVKINEYDREDYIILGYRRLGEKYFDEANLNIVNAFYSQRLWSRNRFDPNPVLVGEEPFIASTAATATRFNYAFSAQGDIKKRLFNTHTVSVGFLSEARPVRTRYSAYYYNADPVLGVTSQQTQRGAIDQAIADTTPATPEPEPVVAAEPELDEEGNPIPPPPPPPPPVAPPVDEVARQAAINQAIANNPVTPYGYPISPFTRTSVGPSFLGSTGNYKGFRYLQSAYLQDVWRPERGWLKRLTVDAGVRVDVYHGVFGNTMSVASLMASVPNIEPFSIAPFRTQRVTNAQVSGRFGGAFAVTRTTIVRGSFSQLFQPPPVDLFSTPPNLTEEPVNGIYPGTLRPLQATRGRLVDASIEQQMGSRFAVRTNLFYKKLKNFGDSGVVQNTPLYNRLSISAQEAYGVESRVDLKPARDGSGFNGFISSTVAIAKLLGSKATTGGIYEADEGPSTTNYPDHDRRLQLVAGLGYRARWGGWIFGDVQVLTGLKNSLDPAIFGPQPARTPPITLAGLNCGFDLPKDVQRKFKGMPSGFDVRIENLLNQRKALNLGSPYQGTRFALPIRVIAGMYWKV